MNKNFSFKKVAEDQTVLCPLMSGRTKISTDEIVNKEVTIVEFGFAPKFDDAGAKIYDELTGEVDTFGVVVFEEFPEYYYCAGTVLTKVCDAWAAAYNGSAEAASADLKAQGGVKVRFESGKTKSGRSLTTAVFL